MANSIKSTNRIGAMLYVRAMIAGGRGFNNEYQAQFHRGELVQLHRITQEAGGHAVGGSVDKFTSMGPKNPKRAQVAETIKALLLDAEAPRAARNVSFILSRGHELFAAGVNKLTPVEILTMDCGGEMLLDQLQLGTCLQERTQSQRSFQLWTDADNMRDAMKSTCTGAARHKMMAFDFDRTHGGE
jgi:hypothetical protein